jgi:protein adenylyltransferase
VTDGSADPWTWRQRQRVETPVQFREDPSSVVGGGGPGREGAQHRRAAHPVEHHVGSVDRMDPWDRIPVRANPLHGRGFRFAPASPVTVPAQHGCRADGEHVGVPSTGDGLHGREPRGAGQLPMRMSVATPRRPTPIQVRALTARLPRILDQVSVTSPPAVILEDRFASSLAEMAVPWQAEVVADPRLLVLNEPLAAELGLDPAWLRGDDGVRLLVGNQVPSAATPVAQAYSGHQFGGFAPRLGDGRALLLGEVLDTTGRLRDLHLKGSGRTPFARGGDGLAAVGPMLREFVVSESMHALGIPTTRSLAVVATGRPVRRETVLPGAVLARVASSHLRVGSFQYARVSGDIGLLRRLADHAISRHYADVAQAERPYLALFEAVVAVQARLVAQWMLVGFVHGVMNTDNMTISGETIDYGPCAFMEAFDPATVFSSIDAGGRYAYGNQPVVAQWNLARLAEALLPLIDDDQERAIELVTESLDAFGREYGAVWSAGMRTKLGLPEDLDVEVTSPLVEELLGLLRESHVEYTSFFRDLAGAARGDLEPSRGRFLDLAGFDRWVERWRVLGPDADAMDRANPLYIPRNHLVEEALDGAAADDLGPLERLLDAVSAPHDQRPGLERYAAPAPSDFGVYRTFCGT